MKIFPALAIGLTLVCASCNRSHSSANSEATDKMGAGPTILASPNPVPAGGEMGETTITWDTGNEQTGEVYVRKNNEPEKRFAAGPSGSQKANWIRIRRRYEFRLYEGTDHRKLLARVQVVRESK